LHASKRLRLRFGFRKKFTEVQPRITCKTPSRTNSQHGLWSAPPRMLEFDALIPCANTRRHSALLMTIYLLSGMKVTKTPLRIVLHTDGNLSCFVLAVPRLPCKKLSEIVEHQALATPTGPDRRDCVHRGQYRSAVELVAEAASFSACDLISSMSINSHLVVRPHQFRDGLGAG